MTKRNRKIKELAELHLRQRVRKYLREHRDSDESRTPLLNDIRNAADIAIRAGIPPAEADAMIMDEVQTWTDEHKE